MTSSAPPPFSPDELQRYARHFTLPHVGAEGQRRLREARVALVGVGGLGSPAALYLAAAGIGTLGLIEFDTVELSNLQRQVLFGTSDVGRPKLEAATARLRDLNPHLHVHGAPVRLGAGNALDLLQGWDVVVDGSDNFPTRYVVNDACVRLGVPLVYGSIFRFDGQLAVFDATRGPCYRCLFREPPPPDAVPSCAEGGVLGVLPGIIGTLQALEALKLVLHEGEPMIGRLLLVDGLRLRMREIAVRKDPSCPACGPGAVPVLHDLPERCAVVSPPADTLEIDVSGLRDLRETGRVTLVDVREPWEVAIAGFADAVHVPLGELPLRVAALDPGAEIVTVCHHGVRSLHAAQMLRAAGFRHVRSLRGGIDAWAIEVEPAMPRY